MSGRELTLDDFPVFFQEIFAHPPFPWQERLAKQIVETGEWPDVLSLPTGSGKTATMIIAVFHLALEADFGPRRSAPTRIIFTVDRRLIVDDAFTLARVLESRLLDPAGRPICRLVSERLRLLSYDCRPLIARRLRGGVPREDDWARTPTQPTILCSTVDQVGSRLLFRGYGISDRSKPVQAGLLGSDCRILLDEAHLAEPFRQTLEWVNHYRGPAWVENHQAAGPWGVSVLSATPRESLSPTFKLEREDYDNPVLARRWNARKPVRLVLAATSAKSDAPKVRVSQNDPKAGANRISAIIAEAIRGLKILQENGIKNPSLGVVLNRVARARSVFDGLQQRLGTNAEVILMVGPARPIDRDELSMKLEPLRTMQNKDSGMSNRQKPLIIVATQCLEAGVDIDVDGMISDAAPLDSLRQRFGRLNRGGRAIACYGAIVASEEVGKGATPDPIYGDAIAACWEYLRQLAESEASVEESPTVDFGLAALSAMAERLVPPEEALSPKQNAPVLLPSHLDLLSQTSPIPFPDPEIDFYLHGPNRQPASVSAIWRQDIAQTDRVKNDVRRLLSIVPPRAAESIQLPAWAIQRWLQIDDDALENLADIPEIESPSLAEGNHGTKKLVFRWAGDDDRSAWVEPSAIRPGDTIVIPAEYGGVDQFGWNPSSKEPVVDVADKAAEPFAGKYFTVRVGPGLIPSPQLDRLSVLLSVSQTRKWRDMRDAILGLDLPDEIRNRLQSLDRARKWVTIFADLYGHSDGGGLPRGAVFVAPFGLKDAAVDEDGPQISTEDDVTGSMQGVAVKLEQHSADVAQLAKGFAKAAGLGEKLAQDLAIAGYLHDIGKADPRFQALLAYGDPLGPDPDLVLAKSAAFAFHASGNRVGLPPKWRHEALSVRLAVRHPSLRDATDPELVVWLVGTHHGWGRPFFPHVDPKDEELRTDLPPVLGEPITLVPGPGPQSLAYTYDGTDWAGLHQRLKYRYGVWGLARLESILRLSDHRASERERTMKGGRVD